MPSIASSPSDDFAHRLHDTGWGLLLMLTGLVWLVPPGAIPAGTWLFGVAAILLGINAIRYVAHVGVSAFSVMLGVGALAAAIIQLWQTDVPLLPICLLVIGASLVAKPLLTRTV